MDKQQIKIDGRWIEYALFEQESGIKQAAAPAIAVRQTQPIRNEVLAEWAAARQRFGMVYQGGDIAVRQYALSRLINDGRAHALGQSHGMWRQQTPAGTLLCAMSMSMAALGIAPQHYGQESGMHLLSQAVGYDFNLFMTRLPRHDKIDAVQPRHEKVQLHAAIMHLNDVYQWQVPMIVRWLQQFGL